ncbi:MAG: Rhomboid family protein, partial [uncultured Nocardioidaceae bacterium]
ELASSTGPHAGTSTFPGPRRLGDDPRVRRGAVSGRGARRAVGRAARAELRRGAPRAGRPGRGAVRPGAARGLGPPAGQHLPVAGLRLPPAAGRRLALADGDRTGLGDRRSRHLAHRWRGLGARGRVGAGVRLADLPAPAGRVLPAARAAGPGCHPAVPLRRTAPGRAARSARHLLAGPPLRRHRWSRRGVDLRPGRPGEPPVEI